MSTDFHYKRLGQFTLILVTVFYCLFLPLSLFSEELSPSRSSSPLSPQVVRFATPGGFSVHTLPFALGKSLGYYKEEGIGLELIFGMKSQVMRGTLKSGDIDYSGNAADSFRAISQGMPFKVIMLTSAGLPHYLAVQPNIRSFFDLKGKRIAIGAMGGGEHYALIELLKEMGFDPKKDVTIAGGQGPSSKLPALFSGTVEAAMLVPIDYMVAQKRGYRSILKVSDIVKNGAIGLAIHEKRMLERKKEVKGMIKSTLKGLNYVRNHKEESLSFMQKEWGFEREGASAEYEASINTFLPDGTISERLIQKELEIGREMGLNIPKNIAIPQLVDFSLLREVMMQGL